MGQDGPRARRLLRWPFRLLSASATTFATHSPRSGANAASCATCRSRSAFGSAEETRAYITAPVFECPGTSTRMVPVGIWRAGTGSLPCLHHSQSGFVRDAVARAPSDSFMG
jgi:hypothetical protein